MRVCSDKIIIKILSFVKLWTPSINFVSFFTCYNAKNSDKNHDIFWVYLKMDREKEDITMAEKGRGERTLG